MPRLALALALGIALAACGSPDPGDESPAHASAPPGISVSVLQYRSDYSIRRLQIKVTNAGANPVTVAAARLTSSAFTQSAAWQSRDRADETVIAPGAGTDLPALLGTSDCSAGDTFTHTARLDLRLADGTLGRTAALPVKDPYNAIAQVHEADCLRLAALAIADLSLVEPLRTQTRDGRPAATLELRLTPTGKPGTLAVESIGPTTLIAPAGGDTWPVGRTVTAGSGPQTVGLQLRPARCDPHAIAEDKLGTVLPLTVRVNGGESGVLTVPAGPQLRTRIQDFVRAACAATG